MRLLCPAKINLHLRVGPLRGDGFHPLMSWFCTTGLFDTLLVEPAEPPRSAPAKVEVHKWVASLVCDQPDIPIDRRNLVVKIAEGWGDEARRCEGATVWPIRADLAKRIPAGAGLGGGSSDAARTLLGLNALWRVGWAADRLSEFAARFGSDLPFFFFGPSSICKGRGEQVFAIPRPAPRAVLLILPPIVMPTGDVYRRFDAMQLGRLEDVETEPDWIAWSRLDAASLLGRLVNDLEPAAFAINPQLARLRSLLEEQLSRPVRMSGSGSSLFTLYDSLEEMNSVREGLQKAVESWGSDFGVATESIRFEAVELAPAVPDDLAGVG